MTEAPGPGTRTGSSDAQVPDPGPPPERLPRVAIATTVALLLLWAVAVIGAPWIAPRVADIANQIDLHYGIGAPAPGDD